jgi:CheY-like chemotaxis protein
MTFELGPELAGVRIDPVHLEQIIVNLVANARDAMPAGGELTVRTENVEIDALYSQTVPGLQPGRHVVLSVTDTGCGMDADTQARIFEPFFTTKETGKGSGLGLATVYGTVKQNRGDVHVYTKPGYGTTFRVYLPGVDEAEPSVGGSVATGRAEGGDETILLVEDERQIRGLLQQLLEEKGYRVLEAESAARAEEILKTYEGDIRLLVSDVVMPDKSGPELAEELSRLRPGVKVIFMSGYPYRVVSERGPLPHASNFLEKPFTCDALLAKVRTVLGDPDR